jgi:hypothetical protein
VAKELTIANLLTFAVRVRMTPRIFAIIRFGKHLWHKEIMVLLDIKVGDVLDIKGTPLKIHKATVGTGDDGLEIIKLWCHRTNRKRFDPVGLGWQKA